MPVQKVITKGKVPVNIYTNDIDHGAYDQLSKMAQLPFIHSHIAAMPDVHRGVGATVGSVIPTRGAIIPAAVGVDIGCGMNAVRLSIKADQLPDNLKPVRHAIEDAVPVGFAMHKTIKARRSTLNALVHCNAQTLQMSRSIKVTQFLSEIRELFRQINSCWTCHPL